MKSLSSLLRQPKTKVYQQHGAEPGWTFYLMAGTTFAAIGGQAMECLHLLPKLVPDKAKENGEKLCRKAFVWWSVALQRGNSMVQLNGVYRTYTRSLADTSSVDTVHCW